MQLGVGKGIGIDSYSVIIFHRAVSKFHVLVSLLFYNLSNFLMSTILRIGSLMKVGFGAAGVEIIRESLEEQSQESHKNDGIFLNSKGSTVKCIFLFCDIRQFTDATESLQEEVFVFTNQIASVIHSICNSYGGSANKNVGDAFLMSWLLEDESKQEKKERISDGRSSVTFGDSFGRTQVAAPHSMKRTRRYIL